MIHRIHIRNFKSIRDVTVDLNPVTVLVGCSGTGKSNFVNSLAFIRDYLLDGGQNVERRYGALSALLPATGHDGIVEFQLHFHVPGFADQFSYTLRFSIPDERQFHWQFPAFECLRYGEEDVFRQSGDGRKQHNWEVEPPLLSVPEAGPVALGRLRGVEEASVAHTALTVGIGVYSFPLDVMRSPPQNQPKWGHSQNGAGGLADTAANYLEVLSEIESSLQDVNVRKGIVATLRRVNPTVTSIELDSIQNPQKAYVGHTFGTKRLALDLAAESDGFRRFYAHLLALYQSPPKQTLVFEEPENGIYPGALSMLADEFKAAPDDHRGQVILTTHGPRLLDHFSPEQIRVVELVDLETRIGPLAQDQRESIEEQLLQTGELLTVDPARLEEAEP